MKLRAFDSSYFRGKSHSIDDGKKNYLVFQPVYRYFRKISNTDHILAWKPKGLSHGNIKPPATSDNK